MAHPVPTSTRPRARARLRWIAGVAASALSGLAGWRPAHAADEVPREHGEDAAGEVAATAGSTSWVRPHMVTSPVRPGAPVRAGDRFRTGADGRIELRMLDGARLSIGPNSDFRVEQYRFHPQRPQRAFYSLAQGLLRTVSGAIGKVRHEDFRLTTPTAVMGIRGTDFTVQETPCDADRGCGPSDASRPRLRVTVHEGRVAVTNGTGTVEVPTGATLRVAGSQSIPAFEDPRSHGEARRPSPVQATGAPADYRYQPLLDGELDARRR